MHGRAGVRSPRMAGAGVRSQRGRVGESTRLAVGLEVQGHMLHCRQQQVQGGLHALYALAALPPQPRQLGPREVARLGQGQQ